MPPATKQVELQVEIVKQHPGPQQVERRIVKLHYNWKYEFLRHRPL